MSIQECLRKSPVFEELSDAELDLLARVMVEHDLPEGHVFVRQGDRPSPSGEAAFLLLDGQVDVTRGSGEHVRTLATMEPGALFGLVALVDDGPRSATCTATTPVRAAGLTRQAFELLHKQDVGLATRFQYLVARQLARNARTATAALAAMARES